MLFYLHARLRVHSGIRLSLRPLFSEGDDMLARLGRNASREYWSASIRCRGPSFETPADGGLLRMRSSSVAKRQTLMVRRRDSAVSNHEAGNGEKVRRVGKSA